MPAGAGRGPRAWPLAFLLYAEATRNPPRARLVLEDYRRQVSLEPEEIDRIRAPLRVRPAVLAAWSFCLGRRSAADAAGTVTAARGLADTLGPLITAFLRSPRA